MAVSTIRQDLPDPVPIANGGTGASTAAGARAALGLGASATKSVANNLTTTEDGYVLDARQGKALNDKIHNHFIGATTLLSASYSDTAASYTATGDGFLMAVQAGKPSTSMAQVKVNGTNIVVSDSDSDYGKVSYACGFIKKGDTITYQRCAIKIWNLRS